ncbi:retrovirus-related pol polyprotein from transposon TNT 1-94 [Tanacetum coccineum]
MVTLAPQDRWSQDKLIDLVNIIGNPGARMLTRAMAKEVCVASAYECLFVDFLSEEEPKKVFEALQHPGWVNAMQDELNQFDRIKVWTLFHAPYGKTIISSKWVFRNKRDETGIVIKNKERLVAQGYNQQEGMDYDETFSSVVRLEAIMIFLTFATYMNFIVYKMDIKSAFLNSKLKEVYVKQPLGFESNKFPNYVCKLDKALYRLKQAPRAWYETLSTFLTKQKFVRVKTLMVPPNKLGPNLNGKAVPKSKSTSCAYKLLGGKLVCWSAKKQQFVAMSLAKAEYAAATGCCANILWMKSQLTDYDIIYEKVPILCDNISVIPISNNPVLYLRTKHIDIRYHFIRDHILKGDIELHLIPNQYQLADIFTKPLDEPTFKRLIVELGPPFTDPMKAISNLDVHVDSKAPTPSSQTEEVPQGHDALADSIVEAYSRNFTPNDSIPSQQDQTKSAEDGLKTAHTDLGTNKESKADEILKKIKLEDLSDLLKDIRSAFFTLDPPQDEPIIGSDESEEEVKKDKYTHATSHDKNELEQQKAKAEAAISSLKSRPSYTDINQLTDLLEKLKTLDSLPSLLNKVIDTLNRFFTVVENALGVACNNVPSAGKATASPTKGEKNTNPSTTNVKPNLHDELVDLLGIDVVTQYYNKKLLYDKYYDKMLKRRKSSKITNCDVLTQKGPI